LIARVWHGWTKPEDGDAYEEFLQARVFPALADRVPGLRDGYVLRRLDQGEDEFVVITFFDSLDAVRLFAGEDYETPVIEPDAARLLTRGDERAAHYRLAAVLPGRSRAPEA
jgi:heme-degrading monooxygenase HmoA